MDKDNFNEEVVKLVVAIADFRQKVKISDCDCNEHYRWYYLKKSIENLYTDYFDSCVEKPYSNYDTSGC